MTVSAFHSMGNAPRDGSEVMLLVRHPSYALARPEDRARWQCAVRGRYTAHNGGGWMWFGLAGTVIGWRPLEASDPVTIDGTCIAHA